MDAHPNLAISTVQAGSGILASSSGNTIIVNSAHTAQFNSVTLPYNITVSPVNAVPSPTNTEIMRLTGINVGTNTLTVTRAQESTTALTTHAAGAYVTAAWTAKSLTDIEALAVTARFDHFTNTGNVGTGEDDLYSDTLPANFFSANGVKAKAVYAGSVVAHATATRQIRVYFGGNLILDTGAVITATAGDWTVDVRLIRESSSVVRAAVTFVLTGFMAVSKVSTVSGLTLTNTQNLKITGEAAAAGAATDDIIAKVGYIEKEGAA